MKIKLSLLLLTVLAVSVAAIAAAQTNKKEKVLSTQIIRGRVTGFETGDYVHVDVKDAKGHAHSFYVDQPQVEYFLAINKGKSLTLTIKKISAYIQEAGSRQTIERVVEVRSGKMTASSWWRAQLKHSTRAKLIDKYDPLVNPGTP